MKNKDVNATYQTDGKSLEEFLTQIAEAGQSWFNQILQNNAKKTENELASGFIEMYRDFFANAGAYLKIQQDLYQEQLQVWKKFFATTKDAKVEKNSKIHDKRFIGVEWNSNPFFAYLKQSYLQMSNYMSDCIAKSDVDTESKQKLQFFMEQYLDAVSPTNFMLTNPEVIKKAIETGGMSLVDGMKNMLHDINSGYIKMTDDSNFQIGKNVAITKGEVIYRNALIELIEYAPTQSKNYTIPLLIVPPCINKYYILDLQQENSLVKFLVDSGYHVFLISWRSADTATKDFNWDEYVELGVINAVDVIKDICKVDKINTLGYCVGGLILTTAIMLMKKRGLDYINSLTHITVMLDHSEPGDIKYFIDKNMLDLQANLKDSGIMSGRVIAQTFSALRANEMIWNYWINNYLLGKIPEAFDILFWNNDAVDLPFPMHTFLLKNFYANNDLIKKQMEISGVLLDLSTLNYPIYLFAAQKDHIVPWKSVFKSTKLLPGNMRFVLGASGHTAGVINPVSTNKRNYWVNENLGTTADFWLENATEIAGSWWNDYNNWLKQLSGAKIPSKKTLGNNKYKPLVQAPGTYILGRALSLPLTTLV